jgi:hypothetical protein
VYLIAFENCEDIVKCKEKITANQKCSGKAGKLKSGEMGLLVFPISHFQSVYHPIAVFPL